MTSPPDPNAYTDAPQPQDNLLLSSARLLFWLFFHPSAWRNYVRQIAPALSPHFSLAELHGDAWRNLAMLRLFARIYLVWPLLLASSIVFTLRGLGLPAQTILLGVIVGMAVSLLAALAVSIAGSVAIGAPVGIAVGVVAGLPGSWLLGSAEGLTFASFFLPTAVALPALIGLAGGLAGGLAFGVAAGVSGAMRETGSTTSLLRQVTAVLTGILIGIGGGLVIDVARAPWLSVPVIGVPFGLAVGWRTQRWLRGVAAGVIVGLTGGFLLVPPGDAFPLQFGALAALVALVTSLFAVPYVLAERIAGSGAGALAGALGSSGGLFLFLTDGSSFAPVLWFSLAGILLGLTLAWWRPILFYPLLAAWNLILLRLDEQRLPGTERPSLLRYHSAFWDEFQRLPLVSLDAHLLLVLAHRPAEGEAALTYLSDGRQRWAAQAAQIELDARRLEACAGVEAMRQAHYRLAAGDLAGPASALLRSFSRLSRDVDAALQQESAYNRRLALRAVEDRLDGLLRELTRSTEPYAARFRPIADRWRQLVAAQTEAMAAEAEQKQEIDSPYIIGVPLTEQQEIFTGRTDVSARIEQLLLDRRRPPLLLYGQRRVGKTSLLHNLGRLLPSTIVPLFVDLQGPASRSRDEAGFLYNVARSMTRAAQRQRETALPPLAREDLLDDPFTRFEEWLDGVEAALAGQTALLMLDEFEALQQMIDNGRFDEAVILGMLRHLIQHRTRFKVLLSGSHPLDEFQRWAGYLINVQVIHIGYLQEDEARQLVQAPVRDFALRYEAAAAQRVLALTRGHPFLIQLLCAEIVALKNEQPPARRRLATTADVETAVAPALAHGSFFFADIEKNQVGDVGRAVLRLLAEAGEGTAVSRQALVDYVPSLLALEQALADLQRRELIEPAGDGYRFQVELIRRWFAERP